MSLSELVLSPLVPMMTSAEAFAKAHLRINLLSQLKARCAPQAHHMTQAGFAKPQPLLLHTVRVG